MKFSRVVFELCEQTDNRLPNKQTDEHTHHSTSHPSRGGGAGNYLVSMTQVVRGLLVDDERIRVVLVPDKYPTAGVTRDDVTASVPVMTSSPGVSRDDVIPSESP